MTATAHSVARFYDELAADYNLVYADWAAAIDRQGAALDRLLRARIVRERPGRNGRVGEFGRLDAYGQDAAAPQASDAPPASDALDLLDCSCGIGTQAIGLARRGHQVCAGDISAAAVTRARGEARSRGVALRVAAVADMRQLPFREASFDAVICADNSLPHLLTEDDVLTALRGMRHVLRPGGVLVLTVRPYDAILRERPGSTAPRTSTLPDGRRAVTFQLWHWHDDGEHYDLEHFQLIPHDTDGTRGTDRPHDTDGTRGTDRPHDTDGTRGTDRPHDTDGTRGTDSPHRSGGTRDTDDWRLAVRRATYWAISRQQLTDLVLRAGFTDVRWDDPDGPASPDDGHGRPGAPGRDDGQGGHGDQHGRRAPGDGDPAGRGEPGPAVDRGGPDVRDITNGTDSSDPSASSGTPGFFQPVLTATVAKPGSPGH